MGRTILTEVAVQRLRPPAAGRCEKWDASLPGFGVRITPHGRRSFVLVTRLHRKPVRVTLGAWPGLSLAQARQLAKDAIHRVAQGEDPRRRRPTPELFETVAEDFVEKHAKEKTRRWKESERILAKYVTPVWRERPIGTIGRRDVATLADAVKLRNGPIMANRTLGCVKKLFAWALDQGLVEAHPAARLAPPGEKKKPTPSSPISTARRSRSGCSSSRPKRSKPRYAPRSSMRRWYKPPVGARLLSAGRVRSLAGQCGSGGSSSPWSSSPPASCSPRAERDGSWWSPIRFHRTPTPS